jgi:hypothetical protein
MKVIFLDFDGVINSLEYAMEDTERWNSGDLGMIDERKVSLINEIIKETDAKVVISSTWRTVFDLDTLRSFLSQKGFIGEVIGATPKPFVMVYTMYGKTWSVRGEEIQEWLDKNYGEVEAFVILDDNSDMAHLTSKLVQTTWQEGMLPEHVATAIAMLK